MLDASIFYKSLHLLPAPNRFHCQMPIPQCQILLIAGWIARNHFSPNQTTLLMKNLLGMKSSPLSLMVFTKDRNYS